MISGLVLCVRNCTTQAVSSFSNDSLVKITPSSLLLPPPLPPPLLLLPPPPSHTHTHTHTHTDHRFQSRPSSRLHSCPLCDICDCTDPWTGMADVCHGIQVHHYHRPRAAGHAAVHLWYLDRQMVRALCGPLYALENVSVLSPGFADMYTVGKHTLWEYSLCAARASKINSDSECNPPPPPSHMLPMLQCGLLNCSTAVLSSQPHLVK